MASAAYMLIVRRYAPFESFGGGFEGDKRAGPSTSNEATARTAQAVVFDRSGAIIGDFGASSGSSHFLIFGLTPYPVRVYGKVTSKVTTNVRAKDRVSFTAEHYGANPLIPLVAPAIDTIVDFTAWFCSPRGAIFSGSVRGNDFPNAEIFIKDSSVPGSKAILLFDFRTAGWSITGPMTKLWGSGENTGLGSFERAVQLDSAGCFVAGSNACPVTKGT